MRLSRSHIVHAALVAAALTGAAGCGGGSTSAGTTGATLAPVSTPTATSAGPTAEPATTAPAALVTAAATVACSASSSTVSLPSGWPADLPLPQGLLLTRTEVRNGTRLVAYGRVPQDFHAVVTFFNRELPKVGYPQSEGQLDPDDAESDFGGKGITGQWKTGKESGCPEQASLVVVVVKP